MPHDVRPRVLIVDDEDSVRLFAQRALDMGGYDVTVAADGGEALALIEQHPPFHLFVIDVMMPDMRGHELADAVRRRERDAKVLYFTGYIHRLFAEQMTLREHEAFVEKPVTVNGLREAVSLLMFGHTRGPRRH